MEGFEELYREHVQSVFRFALHCSGKRELAEDLTSEAFLALYRNLDQIDASRLPGWLLTVVRNRARDHWRHGAIEQRFAVQEANSAPRETTPLEGWILESKDLKPVHRMCLMLRYVHGFSRAEIASQTGLSEMQVKGYLQYALELLRKTYKPVEHV